MDSNKIQEIYRTLASFQSYSRKFQSHKSSQNKRELNKIYRIWNPERQQSYRLHHNKTTSIPRPTTIKCRTTPKPNQTTWTTPGFTINSTSRLTTAFTTTDSSQGTSLTSLTTAEYSSQISITTSFATTDTALSNGTSAISVNSTTFGGVSSAINLTQSVTDATDYSVSANDSEITETSAPWTRADNMVIVTSYSIIVLAGILCNLLTIASLVGIKRLRTTQNMFILSLCFADILLGLNAVLGFLADSDNARFESTELACQVVGFVSFIPPVAIVLSMVVIAENRCKVITVHKHDITHTRVAVYLTLVWTISTLVSLPILFADLSVQTGYFCYCCFYFSSNHLYGYLMTIFLYIIPNLAVAYYYVCIFVHVRRSRKRIQQHGIRMTATKRSDILVARQFIILFVVFNICYIPVMAASWLEDEENSLSFGVLSFVMITYSCTLIANPALYFAMNKNARREIQRRVCKRCSKKNKIPAIEGNELEMYNSDYGNTGANKSPALKVENMKTPLRNTEDEHARRGVPCVQNSPPSVKRLSTTSQMKTVLHVPEPDTLHDLKYV